MLPCFVKFKFARAKCPSICKSVISIQYRSVPGPWPTKLDFRLFNIHKWITHMDSAILLQNLPTWELSWGVCRLFDSVVRYILMQFTQVHSPGWFTEKLIYAWGRLTCSSQTAWARFDDPHNHLVVFFVGLNNALHYVLVLNTNLLPFVRIKTSHVRPPGKGSFIDWLITVVLMLPYREGFYWRSS